MLKNTKTAAGDKPRKPYPDFQLFPHASKRWAKKIRGRFSTVKGTSSRGYRDRRRSFAEFLESNRLLEKVLHVRCAEYSEVADAFNRVRSKSFSQYAPPRSI